MDFNTEDVEMMETEDNNDCNESIGAQNKSIIEFSNKRNFCDINKDLLNNSSKTEPNIETRKILCAKRIKTSHKKLNNKSINQINSITKLSNNQIICVLDTNILLSNLSELKIVLINEEKRRKSSTKMSKIESIIIPWICVQELDHLKNRKNGKQSKFSSITNAIQFINEQLNSNGLVKGENVAKGSTENNKNRNESPLELVDEEINDDKIINCCLRSGSLKRVILLSNDINLCNKALIKGFKSMNWCQFYEQYLDNDKYFDFNTSIDEEPNPKRLAKSSSHSKTCDNSLTQRLSLSPKFSFINKNSSEVFGSSHHSKSEICSPVKSSSKTKNSIKRISLKRTKSIESNKSPKRCSISYEDWISFRYECEQQLIEFIVDVYQNIWQKDWKLMLEINRENATLKDMIRLIRKEWFSNFSDIFNRDLNIKSLVDELHTNSQNDSNYQLLYNSLKKFIAIIEEKPISLKSSDGNCFEKRKTF